MSNRTTVNIFKITTVLQPTVQSDMEVICMSKLHSLYITIQKFKLRDIHSPTSSCLQDANTAFAYLMQILGVK